MTEETVKQEPISIWWETENGICGYNTECIERVKIFKEESK